MGANSPTVRSAPIEIIVLNGTTSSGKTTLAEALQDALEESWLVFGIDTLLSALPLGLWDIAEDAVISPRPRDHEVRAGGIAFSAGGDVSVGAEFRRLEDSWLRGLAAIAASGTRLIVDDVFLDGAQSQERLRLALADRQVLWVGVTCDLDVAVQRERERGDRVVGMVERQSPIVHEGVHYDVVVNSTTQPANELARTIAEHVRASTS
jgi:chloramphenicol 3-O phosphotransferase